MNKCCECKRCYDGEPYYTVEVTEDDPHDCTGNICPDCAGPYLTPDNPNDPRKPLE